MVMAKQYECVVKITNFWIEADDENDAVLKAVEYVQESGKLASDGNAIVEATFTGNTMEED